MLKLKKLRRWILLSFLFFIIFPSLSTPSVSSAQFYDEETIMTSVFEIQCNGRGKLTADDSKMQRAYIDHFYGNGDGELTQLEINNWVTKFETE